MTDFTLFVCFAVPAAPQVRQGTARYCKRYGVEGCRTTYSHPVRVGRCGKADHGQKNLKNPGTAKQPHIVKYVGVGQHTGQPLNLAGRSQFAARAAGRPRRACHRYMVAGASRLPSTGFSVDLQGISLTLSEKRQSR